MLYTAEACPVCGAVRHAKRVQIPNGTIETAAHLTDHESSSAGREEEKLRPKRSLPEPGVHASAARAALALVVVIVIVAYFLKTRSDDSDFWKDRSATLQRIEAETTKGRSVLNQEAVDPANAQYRKRILGFLSLTSQLHEPVLAGWEDAIRRKDKRRELGFSLADVHVSVGLGQMEGIINEYKSGLVPEGRAADNLHGQEQEYEYCKRILSQYSQAQNAIRLEDSLTLSELLDSANSFHNEGMTLLAQNDDLGALLAWMEGDFLIQYVKSLLFPYEINSTPH
jgi:hypothetical protein